MATGEHPQATKTPAVASPDQAEQSKSNTPFEAASKVVRSTQLEAVHFHAVSARALEASRAMPEEVAFVASTKFLRPTVKSTGDGFSTQTTLVFRVGGQTPDGEPPNPYAVIQATLEARYRLKSGAPEIRRRGFNELCVLLLPLSRVGLLARVRSVVAGSARSASVHNPPLSHPSSPADGSGQAGPVKGSSRTSRLVTGEHLRQKRAGERISEPCGFDPVSWTRSERRRRCPKWDYAQQEDAYAGSSVRGVQDRGRS